MNTEQILLVIILMALAAIVFFLMTDRQPKDSASQQAILQMLSNLQQQSGKGNEETLLQLRNHLDQAIRQMASHQQMSSRQMLDQHQAGSELVRDITNKLTHIERTNQQILGFAGQLKSLEKILQNPKQRGILGEYFLESLLTNVLSPNQYQMQHRFGNGYIVDAAIFFRETIIPVDAKFSLEQYNRMLQTDNPQQKAELRKRFKSDLKNRIDETAKYVLPTQGTTDFALMFIPAEGIYNHLLSQQMNNSNGMDLIAYAFQKRVVIVSPASFYAYLQTILHGLKALQIEESVKAVIDKMNILGKNLKNYEQYLEKTGKHLQTALNMHDKALSEFKKMDKNINFIVQSGVNEWAAAKSSPTARFV